MYRQTKMGLMAALLLAAPVLGQDNQTVAPAELESEPRAESLAPADRILRSLTDPGLRALVTEALARNPEVARAEAEARAADLRAPQVRALPDPVAGVTAWLA